MLYHLYHYLWRLRETKEEYKQIRGKIVLVWSKWILTVTLLLSLIKLYKMVMTKLKSNTLRLLHMRLVKIKHSSLMKRVCQEIISPLRKVVLVLLVAILFRWMLIALQLMLLMGNSLIMHNLILITLTLRDLRWIVKLKNYLLLLVTNNWNL